jgi:poly-gamma-glutamate capsule biosynthesis protein CapA/YwtB (metallophosphatase superfamily)
MVPRRSGGRGAVIRMPSRRSLLALPWACLSAAAEQQSSPRVTRIVFGGDVILCRGVASVAHARHDWGWPLRQLEPLFSTADIAFVNLESPFWDKMPYGMTEIIFRAEPQAVDALKSARISVVSTANNHARDCYDEGVLFTADWLTKHGIALAGSGRTSEAAHAGALIERNGVRFGFLGYTYDQSNGNHADINPRVALMDAAQMRQDVAAMKKRKADVIVVSMHAGTEYVSQPIPAQIEFARTAIDAGAKLVVGHHPHVIQPVERYKDGVIFYSLGNLVFDQLRKETREGLVVEARFLGSKLAGYRLIPVDIVDTVPRRSSSRATEEVG